MSVINKMLRDLDQREGASDSVKAPTAGAMPLSSGTGNRPASPPGAARAWMPLVIAGLVLMAGGAAWWWSRQPASNPAASNPPAIPVAVPTTPNGTLAPAPLVATPVAEPPSAVKEPGKPEVKEAVKATVPVPVKESPAVKDGKFIVKEAAKEAVATAPAAPAPSPAPVLVAPAPVPKAAPAVVSTVTPAAEQANPAARQIQAGRDALAQAQALWSAGSHEAAVDLLQGAIGVVERNVAAAPSAAQTQLLASLARELGRMHLADGRPAAAMDALAHLEPQLGREADIWAMRGNAAQRLGRHQDSVNAYASALLLRPNEQRWLLGSAVSLAALGQTAQASDMLENARALGPISKEVQTYLRQAGVRVSEP